MRLDNLETHQKKIFEGLRPGDLENLVLPEVTIDDFEPKSGSPENIVVVSFYVKDLEPANDLASFIERGAHDILDTEVSPAPDEDGNYVVFVEMHREDSLMDSFMKILEDIKKIVKIDNWNVEFYQNGAVEVSLK
jgi:hypothetical protein|tara:strand:- start:262 stop:666 length:405 start_codon:yes stop_codon:yes gene_type:complete